MTDQLPAIIPPGALTTPADTYIVPALIADAGDAGRLALRRILHRQHQQRPHAPGLCARLRAVLRLVRDRGLTLTAIRPFDVAAWVKELQEKHGAPGVKQQLAAVRMLFDWLITGQVVPMNPAAAVRGPKHVVKTGKTPVLDAAEWRKLIDSIPTETVRDLRDRALIATLTYSFARITRGAQDEGRGSAAARVPAGGCGCMRKAASITRCRAITRSPKRCTPTSPPPASPRTARAGCSAPAPGTTPPC